MFWRFVEKALDPDLAQKRIRNTALQITKLYELDNELKKCCGRGIVYFLADLTVPYRGDS